MITRDTAPNGTVVYLNSGSPGLTVAWGNSDDVVFTQWYGDGKLNTHAFKPECLTLNAPKPKADK